MSVPKSVRYVRSFSLEEISPLLGYRNVYEFDGRRIKLNLNKQKHRVFRQSTDCAHCHKKGTHFKMWHVINEGTQSYFVTLHADDDSLMTADHIVPKSRGGPTEIENLQTMCSACNSTKADRMP